MDGSLLDQRVIQAFLLLEFRTPIIGSFGAPACVRSFSVKFGGMRVQRACQFSLSFPLETWIVTHELSCAIKLASEIDVGAVSPNHQIFAPGAIQ